MDGAAITVSSILPLPDDAPAAVRRRLGLGPDEALRIAYVPGPGDVAGSLAYWRDGAFDPRVPIVAYSTMFYELARKLDATALVVSAHGAAGDAGADIRVVHAERPAWRGRFGYLRSIAAYSRAVERHVDEFAPHVAIVAADFPMSRWRRLARKGRLFILSAHNTFWLYGDPPTTLRSRVKRALEAAHARVVDAAVCNSEEIARQLRILTGDRIACAAEYPQIIRSYESRPRSRARRLLFLGRIEAVKGVWLLLDAFADLARRHPDLTLELAGAGGAAEELKNRLKAPGLERAAYLGMLSSDEVHAALDRADLLICPTTTRFNEGLAVVGLEAAAHGVPSVVSSVVPARDPLGDGCAVFEADSAAALRDTLESLIADEARYRRLCEGVGAACAGMYDRRLSWGVKLYEAMAAR